jgi:methionyl-tRNA formyltransferase
MRTVLICHHPDALHREGVARWLASFSTLAGVVTLHEGPAALWRRVRRELRRVGLIRFLDVIAFRVYYRLFLARRDRAWEDRALRDLAARYRSVPTDTPVVHERSPNSASAERFIRECRPDIVVALCKNILAERIFRIACAGTLVMHPGICPEYRNAHGCFWALASDDPANVGMTLLRVDAGVDTGPVFGYFTYPFDEVGESHVVIQRRVMLDNLDALRDRLREIVAGDARPIDTAGRPSATWGQPRLTSYVHWKRHARQRRSRA